MEKPNIIYILVDQQRFDMLGCYGNQIVKTPNIDALRDDGILFSNAFTPTALCGPARTSLFTGCVPTTHGVTRNAETHVANRAIADPLPELPVISDYMPDYEKIYLGKWHVAETKLPKDYGFIGHNYPHYGFPGSGFYEGLVFNQGPGEENHYRDWIREKGFETPSVSEAFFGNNPNLQVQELRARLDCPKEASIPTYLAEEAIGYTQKAVKDGKNFFLWLNYWGPHSPCMVPEPYYSMYKPEDIPVDPAFEEEFRNKPLHHKHVSQMWGLYDLPWSEWQKIIAAYMGYITMIDDSIGTYIDYLKKEGLYEDSLIVFTADHGDAMGSNRLIEKGEFMYDTSYRIPMIIKQPGELRNGDTEDGFVYLHDLFPTAIEAAGDTPPEQAQAASLWSRINDGTETPERDFIYSQFTAHFTDFSQRMIRTKKYKFVFNSSTISEFYNLERDPLELDNRIHDPAYQDVREELKETLLGEMERLKDPITEWFRRIRRYL